MQECAFWGSRWRIVTLMGPKSPKGLNRHFKPTMRKNQIAISSDLCVRLTWNLTGSCNQQQRLHGWSGMVVKQFLDGRRPPFWKSLYRHISTKNHPIFMKFCKQQQILNWINLTWSKMKGCIGQTPSSTERISCFFLAIQAHEYSMLWRTDQYLNFSSHHPLNHKPAVIRTLLERCYSIVKEEGDRKKEEEHVAKALSKCVCLPSLDHR